MRVLSTTGLILAGIYLVACLAMSGCGFFQCLGRDPGCIDSFCDPHFILVLAPLFPALFSAKLLGFGSSFTNSGVGYFSTILATVVALHSLGWLLGRMMAALRRS